MNVCPAIAGDEERRIRLPRNMLNVDMSPAVLPETLQKQISFFRGFQRVYQGMFSAREIIFLNIDEEQSCFHLFSTGIELDLESIAQIGVQKHRPGIMNDTVAARSACLELIA
jgi:hypothetical protein